MTAESITDLVIDAPDPVGSVSASLVRPAAAESLLVLGHGAGAGMHHPFMETLCERLAIERVATLRYQFPYMQRGSRRPDSRATLLATVRAAVASAAAHASDLPLFAGGKSMGGRMTSQATSVTPLPRVRGLVFVGFPLHPAGKPATDRAAHLADVAVDMLFLQGTRDRLADLNLLRPIVATLAGRAELHVVEGADHGFDVLKRSGRTRDDVLDELAGTIAAWMRTRLV